MSTKTYTYKKEYIKKDGTVTYYENTATHKLKNEPGSKQIRRKKPGSTHDITCAIQRMSPENIEIIRVIVNELIAKTEAEQKIDTS